MPRRTHQMPGRVGQEMPKWRWTAVTLAEPELPMRPSTWPARTLVPGAIPAAIAPRWEP
jgi:hypothetical protein